MSSFVTHLILVLLAYNVKVILKQVNYKPFMPNMPILKLIALKACSDLDSILSTFQNLTILVWSVL